MAACGWAPLKVLLGDAQYLGGPLGGIDEAATSTGVPPKKGVLGLPFGKLT